MLRKMLKKVILILFVFFMISSCSKTTPHKTISHIICFGDSLTEGIGASNGQTYPYFLQLLTKVPVMNEGIRGNTSKDGLNRIENISKYQNAIIIVEFGANDYFQQIPIHETKTNIEKIIDKLNNNGNNIIVVSTEDKQLRELCNMLKSLAREKNIIFINGILNEIWNDRNLFFDEIHPNSQGYKLVAQKIYKNIKPLINSN